MGELPSHAEIVVIGGGIVGCSTAYHLARDHRADVVLIEQGELTNGSSWHAAGLVGQLRSSATVTRLLKYSVELYSNLEVETDVATGWKQHGGLRLACNSDRWIEIKRQATTAHSFGLEMELMGPKEARSLWPLMDVSDVVGAAFLPTDGQVNPADITQSLAKGARINGARLQGGVRVEGFDIRHGRIAGVRTNAGVIAAEKVVLCAGLWSREIARLAGVNVPLQPMQHQYLVTEPIDGVPKSLPTLRDPDRLCYYKEEVGGLVMGGYEPNPIPWELPRDASGAIEPFAFQLLPENWDHFEQIMQLSLGRVPALATVGVKRMINGPESFTPDGMFILGEAPEVRGFFVGCGFNACGIASAGGAGWALAAWVKTGEQPLDLWVADIRRFSSVHASAEFVRERTTEAYGKHYAIVFPNEEYASARGKLRSPLYERLAAAGAVFGSKLGWERPNWFASGGMVQHDVYSMGRQNWFEAVGEEHRAVREAVGLFDQSSFAKYEVSGPDAEAALSWICANDVRHSPGRVIYTQMLNGNGGIACDLSVTRLSRDRFFIVTGTGFRTHDLAWIKEHVASGLKVTVDDVTEDFGTLSLFGPRSRALLASVTDRDLSSSAFPFGTFREIDIAGARARALRITYVGELGWELHVPVGGMTRVYDAIMAKSASYGLKLAGYRAIESLRLEKGYRAWGSDLTLNDTPLEAGLGFAVKLKADVPFLGRAALLRQSERPLKRRLMCFTVSDPEITLTGRETILRNGLPVGYLTSGGWGYTVATNIGYGYVRSEEGVSIEFLRSGRFELEIGSVCVPAELHKGPLYDPHMIRVKA
jgi:sarcosine dehydrogenase